ncbi:hypothetical protein GE253_00690 [Niveispirillum sp. SYP-B3756]|uniref:hypothetical protein n=1 Tax=Niveispirillum sp. SYP-B3756 TaxID=2662178 RepID=UPI0012925F05|nr:hypothetical protein [Niveispirillum sp. SYP-B3756]MQP63852.1 hypothetical protein [Niveispirillum sp. SYP-B3756]
MRCQAGNKRYRWVVVCCAGWLCTAPVAALADSQPQNGLTQFHLKKGQGKPTILAGQVKEKPVKAGTPRRKHQPPAVTPPPAPTVTPTEPELRPQLTAENPFGPPPKVPGELSSRIRVAGKGLKLGVRMPL